MSKPLRKAEVVQVDDVQRADTGPLAGPFRLGPAVALPPQLTEPVRRASAFHKDAVERTAALLIVLSRNNAYEGRDPALIADELNCGLVADMLGIGIDTLASVLIDLERQGFVVPGDDGGLRLLDIEGLDRLSEGLLPSLSALREISAAHAWYG